MMKRKAKLAGVLALAICLPALLFPITATAGVLAQISLSDQRMFVYVNGTPRFTWRVSTARRGYHTPTGTFRPQSLARYHLSRKYHNSPMPYSIFFYKGYAIHGSYETRYLGRPASHGCVRLTPAHAAKLFALVQRYGRDNTLIKITH